MITCLQRSMMTCHQKGFSLVELSIVLIIVGTIAGTSMIPLSSSFRQARFKETDEQLQAIREAMLGYLVSAGQLPCPVALNDNNASSHTESVSCDLSAGGVPGSLLGVGGERAENGALLDGWGKPLRYVVSHSDNAEFGTSGVLDWLSAGEPSAVGIENINAELQLCRTSTAGRCGKRDLIADQIVWVIYSLGELDNADGIQQENQDDDTVFTVSGYSTNASQPFDDQLVWASRSELTYWLLKANWLP